MIESIARRGISLVACLLFIFLLGPLAQGEDPIARGEELDHLAGRSVEQYASELDSEDRTVRLRAVRSLGGLGEPAMTALGGALEHRDPAVRYLAAVHLGRIGGESADAHPTLTDSAERLAEMMREDSSQAVRMAAAFALCRAGQVDAGLPLLVERVQQPDRAMACGAADLLGMLGAAARPAQTVLASVRDANPVGGSGDYHIGRAVKNALRVIETSEPD